MTLRRCIGLLLLTASCAPNVPLRGPEPVTARNVDVPPTVARERIASALAARGFAVVRDDDAFLTQKGERADGDEAWAVCERVRVRDRNSDTQRQRLEDSETLRTIVIARIAPLGPSTNVALDTLLLGQYVDSFTNTPFEQRCASSGVLERSLLDAAERG